MLAIDFDLDFNEGIYLLELLLNEAREINIGKLGTFLFHPGYYYYSGSAQNNLKARVKRHLSQEKNLHWHIDYFLEHAEILNIYVWPAQREMECLLGDYLQRFPAIQIPVKGFGSSDCKCESHLFYALYRPNLSNLVHMIRKERKMEAFHIHS